MEIQTVEKVKHLWETWDIRASILISLFIQVFLTFVAPFRKISASGILGFFMWVFYLSADAIAVFIIGLIASNQADSHQRKEILAFWAPFLLLHLGGPDTITALALEDNELWHRHALQLFTQVVITLYVFILSFQHKGLLAPTLLMFFNGFCKYLGRTCVLFYASADSFRDSLVGTPEPGPNYARLMEEYFSAKDAHMPTEFKGKDDVRFVTKSEENFCADEFKKMEEELIPNSEGLEDDEKMVAIAYQLYDMFKALLADGFLSLKDRKVSRDIFLDNDNALKLIEIEINLIFDVFYTKLYLLQRKRTFVRIVCFMGAIVSLILFFFKDRSTYRKIDVIITFVLLGGAIALDFFAILMYILSDWWIIMVSDGKFKSCYRSPMLTMLKSFRWARKFQSGRWSNSISKYSLLKRVFVKPPSYFRWFSSIKRARDFLIGLLYVESQKAEEPLINFITNELRAKAEKATETEVAKEICSARGNLVLEDDYCLVSECLTAWTVDIDYDESLLIWHLATDICYWNSIENEVAAHEDDHRKFSKALSDYMSYLLLRQQAMLSSMVGMSDTRFEDTCAEAKKFMNYKAIKFSWLKNRWWKLKSFLRKLFGCEWQTETPSQRVETWFYKEFSRKVVQVKADVQPLKAKGDKSKSVMFDACRLAKQLEMFGDKQWEITSKVWLELLCYAAVRCSPRSHIAQLNKGGELITLVWLYMAHLGLGERFLQNQGFGWTKLIIQK